MKNFYDIYLFYVAQDDRGQQSLPAPSIKKALELFEEEFDDAATTCIGVLAIEDEEYISDVVWEWDFNRDTEYDIEINDEGDYEIPYYRDDDE
jgi:hypothetical protein